MMKEFDAQTERVSERVSRQINEDRTLIQEKMHAVLMPKLTGILREYRISEKLIEIKLSELEKELIQITSPKDSKLISSNSSSSSSGSSSGEGNGQPTQTPGGQKRPVLQVAQTRQSPSSSVKRGLAEETHLPLYSKSASSLRELQQQPQPTSSQTNNNNNNLLATTNKSIENYINDSNKLMQQQQQQLNLDKNNMKSPSVSLSATGYKYTPLRQSWTNLSQLNQLSSQSASHCGSNVESRKTASSDNVLQEECASPVSILKQQEKQGSRPLTADSLYNKRSSDSSLSNYSGEKQSQQDLLERFDSGGVYFDDNNEFAASIGEQDDLDDSAELKTNFYKKYRTQNIRQKKIHRTQPQQEVNEGVVPRPHSTTNLRSSSDVLVNRLGSLSTASIANLNHNPIGTLYEMSKSYKTIDNIEQGGSKTYSSTSSSSASTTSSRTSASDEHGVRPGKSSFSIYKNEILKDFELQSATSDYDVESDEMPIKLNADVVKTSRRREPVLRQATTGHTPLNQMARTVTNVTAAAAAAAKTSNSILTNVTQSTAFTHNSLPRSRSRTPTDLISGSGGGMQSYRSGTVSSAMKSVQPTVFDSFTVNSPRPLTSSNSTQYIPLSSSISASTHLSKGLKKNKVFY